MSMTMQEFSDHIDEPGSGDILVRLYQLSMRQKRETNAWSIYAAMHALRWDKKFIVAHDDKPFKITNDYGPGYARLLMMLWPELDGFFETTDCKWWDDDWDWDS